MTRLSATVPDEPPLMSVVIDRDGNAWQRLGGAADHDWVRATTVQRGFDDMPMQWPGLIVMRGPLQLVYSPPEQQGSSGH